MRKSDILIIIPAYNEADSIEIVVNQIIDKYGQFDYVIVNDGSTDNTEDICKKNNYNYINHKINIGLAGSFKTGMKYADLHGYDMAIQFDGDGQHNPEYIMAMIKKIEEGNDIVIASRGYYDSMGGARKLGSLLLMLAILVTTGIVIKDPTSGMRLFNKKYIRFFANNRNYGPEPDTLVHLIKNGARVVEIPAIMNERLAGESYLDTLTSINYMLRMLISILVLEPFRK